MATEFNELQHQLLLEFPERCRGCERVAAVIISITSRGSKSEELMRAMTMREATITHLECQGETEVAEPGCFSDPTECYLQSEAHIDAKTTVVN